MITKEDTHTLERVRILFGDQKLSVYGISYGTTVMGTYTSIFPDNVNLMVLDASRIPNYDILQASEDYARSANQRIDYFIASCEFGNDKCGVKDMRACVSNLNNVLQDNKDYFQNRYKVHVYLFMQIIIQDLFGHYELAPGICRAAKENDTEKLTELLDELLPWLLTSPTTTTELKLRSSFIQDVPEVDSDSKPTTNNNPDWPFPEYPKLSSGVTSLVNGRDYSFGAYDEDLFVR